MIVRPWATFMADFPDDQIEDGHDIVRFGGLGVTEAISEILRKIGCTVSEPIYANEHGWELDVSINSRTIWCQVTDIDEFYLCFRATSWLDTILKRHNPDYVETLEKLHDALKSDPRFNQIQWFALDRKGCMGDEACNEPVTRP